MRFDHLRYRLTDSEGKGAIKIWGPPKTLTTTSPRRLLRLVCLPIPHSSCTNSTSLRLTRPLSIFLLGDSSPSRSLCCLDVPFLQRFQVWFPSRWELDKQPTIPPPQPPPPAIQRQTDRPRLEDLTIQPTSPLYLSLANPGTGTSSPTIRDPRSTIRTAVAPHLSPEPRADPCLTHGINTRPLPRQRRRSLQPHHTSHLAPRQAPHKLTSPTSPGAPLGCDDNPASESRLGKLSN